MACARVAIVAAGALARGIGRMLHACWLRLACPTQSGSCSLRPCSSAPPAYCCTPCAHADAHTMCLLCRVMPACACPCHVMPARACMCVCVRSALTLDGNIRLIHLSVSDNVSANDRLAARPAIDETCALGAKAHTLVGTLAWPSAPHALSRTRVRLWGRRTRMRLCRWVPRVGRWQGGGRTTAGRGEGRAGAARSGILSCTTPAQRCRSPPPTHLPTHLPTNAPISPPAGGPAVRTSRQGRLRRAPLD